MDVIEHAPVIFFVVPCYNEEAVLPETSKRLGKKVKRLVETGAISCDSKVLFVDDGSTDKTWELIEQFNQTDSVFTGIKLAHNRGHQNALFAGLVTSIDYCDAAVSLDADLQDDIEVLDEFVKKYNAGAEIVYGVRSSRDTDTFAKRSTAHLFYRFMRTLGIETISDHADYRLMGKDSLLALEQYPERNLYLRGIVPDLGFKTDKVYYSRAERFAGETKYPLGKMISFALDGITSFSRKPLGIISSFGMICAALSTLGLIYALVSWLTGNTVSGWTTIVCSIWLLGGIQLICIGVLGTYVGKIYTETKSRPRYVIEKELSMNEKH